MDKMKEYKLSCALCDAKAKGTGKELTEMGWRWHWVRCGRKLESRHVKCTEEMVSAVGCPVHASQVGKNVTDAMDLLFRGFVGRGY